MSDNERILSYTRKDPETEPEVVNLADELLEELSSEEGVVITNKLAHAAGKHFGSDGQEGRNAKLIYDAAVHLTKSQNPMIQLFGEHMKHLIKNYKE